MRWNLMFLWVILGMAFLSVLIVAAVFTWKLRKIDIEEIIRNGE
jgi:heme/copper-type cytochrome/quinol oxidase subunit 2